MKVVYRSVTKSRRQGAFIPWISAATVQAIYIFIQFTRTAGIASFVRIVCSASIAVLVIPIVGLVFCLNTCHKRFVQWFLTYLYPEERLEVVFDSRLRTAYDINNNHGIVMAVVLVKGILNMEAIRERFAIWMCSSKKFASSRKLLLTKFGCYVWKPVHDDFNIENHITSLSGKLDQVTLKHYVSGLKSMGLPSQRPAWQIIAVTLSGPAPSYAMVIRLHHVLASDLFQSTILTRTEEKPCSNTHSTDGRPQTFRDHLVMAIYTLVNIASCLVEVPSVLVNELMLSINQLKRRRPSGKESVYWTEPLSLQLLKKVANVSGVSTNEVLINCITGSLRHYYSCMEGYVPEYMISAVPTATTCNGERLHGFATTSLPIPMADPKFRLLHFHRNMASTRTASSVVKILFLNYVDRILPYPLAKLFLKLVMRNYSSIIADYYVPKEIPNFPHGDIKMIYLWRPLINRIGISFSIMYLHDKVAVSVKADLSSVQRPDLLLSYFIRELKDLCFDLNVREGRQHC